MTVSTNLTTIPEKQIPTKAFVVNEPNAPFVLSDVVLDEVRSNEVLVEMKYTGLCHTVRSTGVYIRHITDCIVQVSNQIELY